MVYQPECGISLMLLIKFGFSFMTLSEEMWKESDGFDAVSASTDLDSSSSSLVSDASYLQWNQNIFEYSRFWNKCRPYVYYFWIFFQALQPY
jgi:hypothetical protein